MNEVNEVILSPESPLAPWENAFNEIIEISEADEDNNIQVTQRQLLSLRHAMRESIGKAADVIAYEVLAQLQAGPIMIMAIRHRGLVDMIWHPMTFDLVLNNDKLASITNEQLDQLLEFRDETKELVADDDPDVLEPLALNGALNDALNQGYDPENDTTIMTHEQKQGLVDVITQMLDRVITHKHFHTIKRKTGTDGAALVVGRRFDYINDKYSEVIYAMQVNGRIVAELATDALNIMETFRNDHVEELSGVDPTTTED